MEEGTTLLDAERFGTPTQPMDLGRVDLSDERVSAYLRAVGDGLPIYRETGLAPPLFSVALALGQILRQRALPPGAIHSLQEFETLRPIRPGCTLHSLAWLERQRERAGLRFLTFGISMGTPEGDTVQSIRTTLMIAGETAASASSRPEEPPGRERDSSARGDMGTVRRTIGQRQLTDYSKVSGDDNPLHLDAEFAAGTQFGGIIAHGMLTLAFVCEMLAGALGEPWLAGGALQARFKGAAYTGAAVETWGRAGKTDENSRTYAIGLANSTTGDDLITGTARIKTNR